MALTEPEKTAWDYNILDMHMKLKHKETSDLAVLHGWGDKKDEPWLELYFPDKEPADKNAERSDCYGWRRMSMWMTMDGKPLYKEAEPYDPETAKFRKNMENAMKLGAGEAKGGADDDAKSKEPKENAMPKEPEPKEPKEPEPKEKAMQMPREADTQQMPEADTQQMPEADSQLPTDGDEIKVEKPPAKRSKYGP